MVRVSENMVWVKIEVRPMDACVSDSIRFASVKAKTTVRPDITTRPKASTGSSRRTRKE